MDGEYYEVERICKYKIKNGKRHYLIKWKNFPSSSNTWEPEENLTQDLVAEYHRRSESKKSTSAKKSASVPLPPNPHRRRIVSSTNRDDDSVQEDAASNLTQNSITPQPTEEEVDKFKVNYQGKIATSVNGAVRIQGQLFHKVSWKDTTQDELIPAKFSNFLWPSLVIDFYQRHSHFVDN